MVATPRSARASPFARAVGDGLLVYTFVTAPKLYEQLTASFTAAGFPAACFRRLSDKDADPFAAINRISHQAASRWAVLCHQDLLADRGAGLDQLLSVLADLDRRDPDWIVAGNAGVTRDGRVIRNLHDKYGGPTSGPLPQQVVTLDENFLVLNLRHRPCTTPGLVGFHTYGTDVSLNAMQDGGSCWVIDFPVTHVPGASISGGIVPPLLLERLEDAWNTRFWFLYAFTPQDVLFLSRSKVLRQVFGSRRARAWVRRYRSVRNSRRQRPIG